MTCTPHQSRRLSVADAAAENAMSKALRKIVGYMVAIGAGESMLVK